MRMSSFIALCRAQLLLAALACAVTAPVFAGAQFSAVTKNTNTGTRLPAFGDATVDGAVDNEHGRLEYLESGAGSLPKGSIVVTTDGGRTAKLYNTKDETCGDMPLPTSASTVTRAQAISRYENIEVKKL